MFEAIENAFPHLIMALRRTLHLTHMQAVGVIYAHRYGDGLGLAIMEDMGGAKACIRHTVQVRHYRRSVRLAA
jgi:hypothetical protein